MADVILLNRIRYSPYQHKNMLILIFIIQNNLRYPNDTFPNMGYLVIEPRYRAGEK
jgi:hypothetical protein